MSGVWEAVEKIVRNGQVPKLTLSETHEVKPRKRVVGRPRHRDPSNPYAHYKTPRQGYGRPLCLVCKKKLRVCDVEVCSEDCHMSAVKWLSGKLATIRGHVRVPITAAAAQHMRDAHLVREAV